MAVCSRCGAALIASARFCATCGAPVATIPPNRGPTAPLAQAPQASPPSPGVAPSAPDPFAKTMMGDPATAATEPPPPVASAQVSGVGPIAPARPNPVSPMASSFMTTPNPSAKRPSATPPGNAGGAANPNQARPPTPQVGYGAPPAPWGSTPNPVSPRAAPVAPTPYAAGAMVLVYWADGNRYPGTVIQTAPGAVLVSFPNGQQQWVDAKYVSSGS